MEFLKEHATSVMVIAFIAVEFLTAVIVIWENVTNQSIVDKIFEWIQKLR